MSGGASEQVLKMEPTHEDNIVNDEGFAVMLATLADCDSKEDYQKFHDIVGHNLFLTMALDDIEAKEVQKVHRYFGHRSGRKVWELF